MRALPALLGAVLLAGGCRSEGPPAAPPPDSPPERRAAVERPGAAASGAPAPAADGALALRAPTDQLPLAAEIRARQSAVKARPDQAAGWVELGRAWLRAARLAQNEALFSRVEAAARRAMALDPGQRQARHLLGLVLRQQHRFADLRTLAEELARTQPDDDLAWGLLADAALALGDLRAVERALDRMLDVRPALPSFSRAAWLRWLHNDVDGALSMWNEAARAGGQNDPEPLAWCLSEAGDVEWHRGRLDAAERLYAAALQRVPTYAGALLGLGRVALARGQAPAAVKSIAAAYAARPSEIAAEWHAMALRAAGDTAAAEAIEQKLAAASAFDDARSIALYLAHRKLKPQVAVERARADFAERQDLYAHDALGWALFRAGDLEAAEPHLSQATRLDTPDAMLHAHRGLLALARGQTAVARRHLDRAWALNRHAHPVLMAEVAAARATLGEVKKDGP